MRRIWPWLALGVLAAAPCFHAPGAPQSRGLARSSWHTARAAARRKAQELPPAGEGAQYTCSEDGECVVEPCPPTGCRASLDVRIDDVWYDLSGWRKAHPGGEHWIDHYDGRDATEVMHAFHSAKGREMLKRMPRSKKAKELEASCPPPTPLTRAFRNLRAKLEDEGWWKRSLVREARQWIIWATCTGLGVFFTHGQMAALGVVLLALANTQAGWLAHDYQHGVDSFCDRMRWMGPLCAGLSPIWWSDKHNKHHAVTNEVGMDEDIATDPVLFVRAPDPKDDSWHRKVQHWTAPFSFSMLFVIWRIDSIKAVWKELRQKRPRKGAKAEAFFLSVHWALLLSLVPWKLIPAYILLSGLITAIITTATHQSEEMFEDFNPDFVDNQFRTTRDATVRNPFAKWIWGGMQYQLEHHLFPSMPRSKYPALKPILQKFAEVNHVPGGHRSSPAMDLVVGNWKLYAKVAHEAPRPGAKATRLVPA
ncbi:unnamed protein product [Effrenium voratum]|nr:unnamed protein product [Effrenium voratum]CAJ1421889.1 unnamed protein product [Effrenium voratum]